MNKKILHLHVKAKYFNEIKSGIKAEEYRLFNSYWCNRLDFKTFDEVHILSGYPKKDDLSKRIIFPWMGYEMKKMKHPEFSKEYCGSYEIRRRV